jgi:hypothetical protein
MTIGIAFQAWNHAGVVTDRQVTASTQTWESTKCGVATYSDGRLAYTMAGLSADSSRRFRAEFWLAEARGARRASARQP